MGVETGGCPHTAIREDASINLEAIDGLSRASRRSTWSSSRAAATTWRRPSAPSCRTSRIYVIDVAAGDKIPRKGGPGITKSRPARHQQDRPRAARRRVARGDGPRRHASMRGERPFVFTCIRSGEGVDDVAAFVVREGLLDALIRSLSRALRSPLPLRGRGLG